MRYLLLDRIDELEPGVRARGTKCIALAEDVFEHHFPGQPVYPGALLLEALAQLGGALVELSRPATAGAATACVLGSAKARFRRFARPGDQLRLDATLRRLRDGSALVETTASCGEDLVAEAELLFLLVPLTDPHAVACRRAHLDQLTRGLLREGPPPATPPAVDEPAG